MKQTRVRRLRVPLAERPLERLKEHSVRTHRPATPLAKEAIESWLSEQVRLRCNCGREPGDYGSSASSLRCP